MKRYQDALALRRALEARLKRQSEEERGDLGRLRRLAVFDRLAVRLSADPEGEWILKGGAALEFRLRDRARATKDLDLAVRASDLDGHAIRDALLDALTADPDGDWFTFRVGPPVELMADGAGRPAWRFSVEAGLAGKPFAGVRLDVAARGEEVAATEPLALLGVLDFAGIPARTIEAVDRRQHFAETVLMELFMNFAINGWGAVRFDDFTRQLDALDAWDDLCDAVERAGTPVTAYSTASSVTPSPRLAPLSGFSATVPQPTHRTGGKQRRRRASGSNS